MTVRTYLIRILFCLRVLPVYAFAGGQGIFMNPYTISGVFTGGATAFGANALLVQSQYDNNISIIVDEHYRWQRMS